MVFLPLWLAGCQTGPQAIQLPPPSPTPPLPTVTVHDSFLIAPPAAIVEVDPPPATVPTNLVTTLPTVVPQVVVNTPSSNPPAIVTDPMAWPSNWVNTWLSLDAWGQYNRLGKPALVNGAPALMYQFQTTNGTILLKMGSRIARCNGLECWLGYAPQMIKGVPYIYALDALKSFQALLNPRNQRYNPERTVVIDAGHGGKDSGSRNTFSTRWEKEYTLDWALRLRALLAEKGWKVVMTRSNDVDVPLPERVQTAERVKADLFISLHFNSGLPNKELAGIETYCLTPVGLPSNLVRTYEDDPKALFPNNAFDEQNYQVAYKLHRSLMENSGAPDRGLRRARFMSVLRGQNRPAVLIEGGYLSNPNEAKKIASAAYRQNLAEAVARGLD
jgi:N-acetylmuramoyl-L-alanine amidase